MKNITRTRTTYSGNKESGRSDKSVSNIKPFLFQSKVDNVFYERFRS